MNEIMKELFQERLGEECGEAFYELYAWWLLALARYDEFNRLFGSRRHVEHLNAIGGGFFGDVQHIFWDDLMLRLCRLTDPVGAGTRRNLTIQIMPGLCAPTLRNGIQSLVDQAVEAVGFARDHRNRRIAHADYHLALRQDCEPLPAASLEKAKRSLDSIHAVLDTVLVSQSGRGIDNHVTTAVPGAEALLAYTSQMARALVFIDSIVDSTGESSHTDSGVVEEFLRKLGRPLEEVDEVMELRAAAKRLRGPNR
ncbi:MAG: hypothetical protein F4X67_07750 [Gemmatimonadales bacterium]|nr:hypothetical protein [Gemmatimonadales bacterium]